MLVESLFGGSVGGEEIPMWIKVILIVLIIIFVVPALIIAISMLTLALVAFVYGGDAGTSVEVVKDGVQVVKETFKGYDLA